MYKSIHVDFPAIATAVHVPAEKKSASILELEALSPALLTNTALPMFRGNAPKRPLEASDGYTFQWIMQWVTSKREHHPPRA